MNNQSLPGENAIQRGREKRANSHHAQHDIAAAKRVSTIKNGSLASRGPSTKARQMWAKVIKPKITPVVARKAFTLNSREDCSRDNMLVSLTASLTG